MRESKFLRLIAVALFLTGALFSLTACTPVAANHYDLRSYVTNLKTCVQSGVRYKVPPRKGQANPTAVFRIKIAPSGNVQQLTLLQSSGIASFDSAVTQGIRSCHPFPRPPTGSYPPAIQLAYYMY